MEDPVQEIFNTYGTNPLIEFSNIYENYLGLSYTKSYGVDNKTDLQFFTKFFNRIHNSNNYILDYQFMDRDIVKDMKNFENNK